MVTDLQVRRLFDMRNKHEYLYQAADAAGKGLIHHSDRGVQCASQGFQDLLDDRRGLQVFSCMQENT